MAREKGDVTYKTFVACVEYKIAKLNEGDDVSDMSDDEVRGAAYAEVEETFKHEANRAGLLKETAEWLKKTNKDGKVPGHRGRKVSADVEAAIVKMLTDSGKADVLAAYQKGTLDEKTRKALLAAGRGAANAAKITLAA